LPPRLETDPPERDNQGRPPNPPPPPLPDEPLLEDELELLLEDEPERLEELLLDDNELKELREELLLDDELLEERPLDEEPLEDELDGELLEDKREDRDDLLELDDEEPELLLESREEIEEVEELLELGVDELTLDATKDKLGAEDELGGLWNFINENVDAKLADNGEMPESGDDPDFPSGVAGVSPYFLVSLAILVYCAFVGSVVSETFANSA